MQPSRKSWSLFALGAMITTIAVFSQAAGSAKFQITSRGQPAAEIVVEAENPEAPLAFAGEELQRYVKEISGAELPSVRAKSRKPVILLVSRPFDKQASADPREVDHYRLKVNSNELLIEGASARAVLFGVYDVLERLGCGWCVPGDDTVPKRDTLELDAMEVNARPAFKYRMMLDFPLMSVAQSIAISDWIAKNRLNWVHECANAHGEPKIWYDRRERVVPELRKRGLHLIFGGHTMHTWVPETNSTAHPDWFALEDGKQKPPTLCISNPEMTAELINNMRRFLDRCPEVEVIDFWHTDGTVFCHCAKCTRGVVSGGGTNAPTDAVQAAYVISYVELINRVAEAIGKSHPKVMIGPLIYSQTDRAMPDAAPVLADNVLIGVAHFYRDSFIPLLGEPKSAINLRFLGNDLTWIAKSKHSYIYEYYNGWVPPYVYPGAQVIVRDLQTLAALEVQGVSSDMYGYSPVNMYAAARAFWSSSTSWTNIVHDFCNRYYGDVADEMAENEIRLETGIYGISGYQGNNPNKRHLDQQRPQQIALLKRLAAKTKDPQVKARLERELKPWEMWNKEPRFWAFPEFKDSQ